MADNIDLFNTKIVQMESDDFPKIFSSSPKRNADIH